MQKGCDSKVKKASKKNKIKRFIIITGMSGAGKTSALDVFEDQGFYVIDNLPLSLIPQLVDVLSTRYSATNNGVAAVIDAREGSFISEFKDLLKSLKKHIDSVTVIFVDANDESLVRRFETTRRRHPMAKGTTILGGIAKEKNFLDSIKHQSDIVIDTTGLSMPDFKKKLLDNIEVNTDRPTIVISSFGFKYGLPQDADYLLDVRFLHNPNYVNELKHLTGKDQEVNEFLKKIESFDSFICKAQSLLEFVASVYSNTGKKQLHVAIGCTGGQHRSVAVAENLASKMKIDNKIVVEHRDIDKGRSL